MAPSIASSSATAPASRKISARSSTRPSLASTGSAPTASTSSGIATPDNGSASIAASISSKRSKRSDPTVSSTPCRPNTGTFSRKGALRPTPDGYLAAIGVGVQMHFFVLDRAPQPFDENVVHEAATSVHRNHDAGRHKLAGESLGGESGALDALLFVKRRFV